MQYQRAISIQYCGPCVVNPFLVWVRGACLHFIVPLALVFHFYMCYLLWFYLWRGFREANLSIVTLLLLHHVI